MAIHKLDFETTHCQFYMVDKLSPFKTASEEFWTEKASEERLAIEEGLLGIATECYGAVKATLQVLDVKPAETDLDTYDHVVEGSLKISSGILQIFPCLEKIPAFELGLTPTTYRVRIGSSNLGSVEDDDGDDFYTIQMWPEIYRERSLIKGWALISQGSNL